jgi:endoglucanase
MGPRYGNPKYINKLKPLALTNVVYTVHYYEPFKYVHQGALEGLPDGLSYPTKKWNKKALVLGLAKVDAFLTKYKKRKFQMYAGEFGVARWALGGATYLNDLLSIFEKKKWHWTMHGFRDSQVWSVEHGNDRSITTRSDTPTDRYQVLTSYLGRNAIATSKP